MRPLTALALALLLPVAAAAQKAPSLEQLRQKVAADSNNAVAHYDLAMALWDRKDWDAAEAALRTAVAISPSYADALLALGQVGPARGEKYWKNFAKQKGDSATIAALQESARYYRRAFLLNPLVNLKPLGKFEGELTMGLMTMRSETGRPMSLGVRWGAGFNSGVNDVIKGDYAKGFQKLAKVRQEGIESAQGNRLPGELLWFHALAAAHIDSFNLAAQYFDELYINAKREESRNPDLISPLLANDYRFFVSTMLYLGGHYNQALAGFQQALENDLSLYVAHVQLARIHEVHEQWDQSIQERERALAANPEDAGLMIELAGTLLLRNRRDDAAPLLENAARINPRDPRAPYLLGQLALSAANHAEARRMLNQFITIAPSTYATQVRQVQVQLESIP